MAKVTVTKEVCDRCGIEMGEACYSRVGRRIGFWFFSGMTERDICRPCRESFDLWWNGLGTPAITKPKEAK